MVPGKFVFVNIISFYYDYLLLLKHRSSGHDMNVERVWEQNITGRGAVVSILDDGIEHNHPDLQQNYVSCLMEEKIHMELLVAIPTGSSC